MKLVKSKNIWIWDGGYDSRHIPKAAKFRWNIDGKFWWTDQPDCAVALIEYTEGRVRVELEKIKSEMDEQLEASTATDADIHIPTPEGMEYYGYQKAGIAYALKNKNVLFGDEMGLGKTPQSIGVINCDTTINRVLIVTPASLKYNWKKELDRWLLRNLSVEIISSTTTTASSADILIINYDIISSEKVKWIKKIKFDLIIADEAHYVKNDKAKRSITFYELAAKANRKLLLTGTPILNRPVELYHIIKCLGFNMDYWAYVRRYCNATKEAHGWNLKGASNLEELQVRLRQSIMVRRMKVDVLHELPPKRRQIIELDPSKYASYIDAEQAFINRHTPTFMTEIDSPDMDDYETKVGTLKEMKATHIAEMARLRHMTALAKVPDVIEHIKTILEETNKVVVFAHHRDVLQAIYDAFDYRNVVMLIGGMGEDDKDDAVNRFQNDPDVKIFVGSIHAAGVGLTLTAASLVVFAELDWTPSLLTQAEDRTHRIGQTSSVLVQHIVIDGSIDSNLAKRIVSKQNVIDRALNANKLIAHRASEKKKINDAIKRAQDEIEDAKKLVNKQLSTYAEIRAKEIIDGIPQYTQAEINNILYKLRYLITSRPGFNRMDVGFAHVLAAKDSLSNRQAFAAEKMLKKYSSQLQHI